MTRKDWLMIGALLLLGSAVGIAFAWFQPTLSFPAGGIIVLATLLSSAALFIQFRNRRPVPDDPSVAPITTSETDWKHLWHAGMEVSTAQNYGDVLRSVVDHARELLSSDSSALCVMDEQKRWWVIQGVGGKPDAFEVNVKPFSRNGAATFECPVVRFKYRETHLDAPIMREGKMIGCLCVANSAARDFSPREHELLQLIADQAAVSIDHARRLEIEGTRAASEERERLAREMHDTLAQLLGFVGFKTESTREFLAQGKIPEAQKQLEQLTSLAQELYADTRELILGLKTEIEPERSLFDAIRIYAEWFGELSGVRATILAEEFESVRLPPAVEVQLIRVIQESLSNVRKHARAQNAQVRFARVGEFARITITDDGIGFDASHPPRGNTPRFGLSSIRERVESVGGEIKIDSVKGRGTEIVIQVPLIYRGGTT